MTTEPNLEEVIEQHDDASARIPFKYFPINPEESYDSDSFLDHYDAFQDFKKYKESLDKNINDVKNRSKLFGKLFGNPSLQEGMAPDAVAQTAKMIADKTENTIVRYAETNRNKLLDIIAGREGAIYNLMGSVPLYSTDGENKRHDEVVGLVKYLSKAEKMLKGDEQGNRNMGEIRKDLTNSIKDNNVLPNEYKKLYLSLIGGDRFAMIMYAESIQAKRTALNLRLTTDGKNIDDKKIKAIVKRSMDVAYEKLTDITDKIEEEHDENKRGALIGDLNDAWDDNLKPYYLAMANLAYNIEKEEHDNDDDLQKQRIELAESRNAVGMR